MTQAAAGTASRMASQSGLLMLGNMFTLLVGFPFQIYLARMLGAQQLGAFGLFEVIAQTAGTLFGFGLATALVRFIPHHIEKGEGGSVRRLLAWVYGWTVAGGALAVVVLMAGRPLLLRWVPELAAYPSLYPFLGAMAVLGMLIGLSAQALRAFMDIRYMIIVASFVQLAVKVAVAVVLISLGWELAGYLCAVVISVMVALAGMVWGIHRHLRQLAPTASEAPADTRQAWWSFSRTMYANSLVSMAGPPAERVLLAGAIDLASVGVLMAVRQLQGLTQVLFQILVTVIGPMFVAAKARGDMEEVKRLYHIATDWMCRLGFPLLMFLLVFADDVLALYGTGFAQAGRWPLVVLVIGQLFNLLTGPHGAMLNLLGHEKDMFKLYLVSSGSFLLALVVLAPLFGLLGVALASLLPIVFLNLIELHFMNRWLGIGWWSGRYRRLAGPMIAVCAVATLFKWTSGSLGAVALAGALAGLYLAFIATYLSARPTGEDVEVFDTIRRQLGFKR
ncbi:MAG TPA: oligosaccharide flippase family protein [Ramlibacter sp.]|nr:oligosaccharide flippase family protein [Ramlibacter sp.]